MPGAVCLCLGTSVQAVAVRSSAAWRASDAGSQAADGQRTPRCSYCRSAACFRLARRGFSRRFRFLGSAAQASPDRPGIRLVVAASGRSPYRASLGTLCGKIHPASSPFSLISCRFRVSRTPSPQICAMEMSTAPHSGQKGSSLGPFSGRCLTRYAQASLDRLFCRHSCCCNLRSRMAWPSSHCDRGSRPRSTRGRSRSGPARRYGAGAYPGRTISALPGG